MKREKKTTMQEIGNQETSMFHNGRPKTMGCNNRVQDDQIIKTDPI